MAGIADVNGRRVPSHREAMRVEGSGHTARLLVRPREGRGHGPPGRCRPPVGRHVAPVAVVAAA